jgi:hypothetical protein
MFVLNNSGSAQGVAAGDKAGRDCAGARRRLDD